jgi:hypothetical protein
MSLAVTASVVGIGAGGLSIYNAVRGGHGGGGGGSGTGGPGAYIPTGLHEADDQWQGIMRQLAGLMQGGQAQTLPLFLQSLQQMEGLDTSGLTRAGQQAGQQYGNLAGLANMYAGMQGSEAGNLMGAGNALWQTAQDPNNALRDRLLGQVQQTTRAGDTARGIAMSPQSAGLEADASSNFLQNWEQNKLNRELMGLQGMTGAAGQGSNMLNQSMAMGQLSPQMMLAAGMTPFQMQQMAAGWPMQAGTMFNNAMSGLYQPWGQLMQNIIPYMNSGQGATNQAFNQGQVNMNNMTSGLYAIMNGMRGLGGNPSGGYGLTPGWDWNPPGGWTNLSPGQTVPFDSGGGGGFGLGGP